MRARVEFLSGDNQEYNVQLFDNNRKQIKEFLRVKSELLSQNQLSISLEESYLKREVYLAN
jgi:hypothetical protein